MCLCSFQCWFWWWRNEHSCPSNFISSKWNTSFNGSHSKYCNSKKRWTDCCFDARLFNYIFFTYFERHFLKQIRVHKNYFLVLWCWWAYKFTSSNNYEACMPLDRKTSHKFSFKAKSISKSYCKFPNKIENIHKKRLHVFKRWLGTF